jgi:hypothetical protein
MLYDAALLKIFKIILHRGWYAKFVPSGLINWFVKILEAHITSVSTRIYRKKNLVDDRMMIKIAELEQTVTAMKFELDQIKKIIQKK